VLAGAREQAEFVCVQPHDDWVEPEYLATLLDAARDYPRAAVVFSDVAAFGTFEGVIAQDSVIGTPMERQLLILTHHFGSVAYRGLNRASALKTVPPISGNNVGNFACDTVWMARVARAGDLVRVPRVLYHKRFLPNSASAEWATWDRWQKGAAWVRHCLDMLAEGLTVATSIEERGLLINAARGRLAQRHLYMNCWGMEPLHINYWGIRNLSRLRRWGLRAAFETGAAMRSDIGPLWRLNAA
jgi:hypothetical protein